MPLACPALCCIHMYILTRTNEAQPNVLLAAVLLLIGPPQVAVGSDPRVSGPLLGPAVLAGLLSAGAEAVDVGLATTPAMFYGIVAPGACAAANLTKR